MGGVIRGLEQSKIENRKSAQFHAPACEASEFGNEEKKQGSATSARAYSSIERVNFYHRDTGSSAHATHHCGIGRAVCRQSLYNR